MGKSRGQPSVCVSVVIAALWLCCPLVGQARAAPSLFVLCLVRTAPAKYGIDVTVSLLVLF